MRTLPAIAATLLLGLVLAACTESDTQTASQSTSEAAASEPACPRGGEELDDARLYIEHNATDEDTGVHGSFGGEAWSELCIWDPAGELVLHVRPQAQLGDLGLSDFFFESREPPNDEQPIAQLRAAFPEGEYTIGGTGFDGTSRTASARFTHSIAEEPVITSPPLADEESPEDATVPLEGLVVRWEPVTTSIDGDAVEIVSYEVIITKVEHDDPDALSLPVFDVHLGPDATSLTVSGEFLEGGTVYELEVLALEASGNQTIALGFFTTE